MISAEEIDKLATLARLELAPAEKLTLQKDLSAILDYVAELKNAPIGDLETESPSEGGENINVLRADEPAKPFANLPLTDGFVKVKKIL